MPELTLKEERNVAQLIHDVTTGNYNKNRANDAQPRTLEAQQHYEAAPFEAVPVSNSSFLRYTAKVIAPITLIFALYATFTVPNGYLILLGTLVAIWFLALIASPPRRANLTKGQRRYLEGARNALAAAQKDDDPARFKRLADEANATISSWYGQEIRPLSYLDGLLRNQRQFDRLARIEDRRQGHRTK